MGEEKQPTLKGASTKEIITMGKCMVKVSTSGKMALSIRENGETIV